MRTWLASLITLHNTDPYLSFTRFILGWNFMLSNGYENMQGVCCVRCQFFSRRLL
jgi:hypothetical protein